MNKDSMGGIFVIASSLCIVCSVVVSMAAVNLRPIQEENVKLDVKKNILSVAGLLDDPEKINEIYDEKIAVKVVDIATGDYVDAADPATFDYKKAASDDQAGVAIPMKKDVARIKRRPKQSLVYLVNDQDGLNQVILPVRGKGLWSTMIGFVSVDPTATFVKGLSFYAHAETPGLGGEIDNPDWKAIWPGKKIYGDDGSVKLWVLKGAVIEGNPNQDYEVDGLSGATLTARGVGYLIQYWLGDEGFKPYLTKLAANQETGEGQETGENQGNQRSGG